MYKIFQKFVIITFLIITSLFAISIASRTFYNLIISIITVIMLLLFKKAIAKNKIKPNKKVLIGIIVIGILFRISILFMNYNKPLQSDYLFFYQNAANFQDGQELNNRYIATFPYLAPYVIVLGTLFKIFNSTNYLLVILLNTTIDVLTSIVMYHMFKQEDKTKGMLATSLWLINPINIIWNTMCCPVVIVNFGITCILFLFEKLKGILKKEVKWGYFWSLNIIYGFIIGIFNSFRPIMIIVVIATIIYYIYKIIENYRSFAINIILGIIILLTSYKSVNIIFNIGVSNLVKQEVATTPGWTLYLGSNLEEKGMWNAKDSDRYNELFNNEEMTVEEFQKILKKEAIERYKGNGVKNLKLFSEKFQILTNNTAGYSYNSIIETATIKKIIEIAMRIYSEVSMIAIILMNIYLFKFVIKDIQAYENMIMYMLLIIGIITSHLLVEVHMRYILPIMPILIIISTYTIKRSFDIKY